MAEQLLCLKWNEHTTTLVGTFKKMLEQQSYVDVTLACEGRHIKAHRLILSSCSQYLDELLDAQSQNGNHPIIILPDMKFDDLKVLVDFIYGGEVRVSIARLPSLLKAAETLKIRGLTESGKNSVSLRHVNPAPKIGQTSLLPISSAKTNYSAKNHEEEYDETPDEQYDPSVLQQSLNFLLRMTESNSGNLELFNSNFEGQDTNSFQNQDNSFIKSKYMNDLNLTSSGCSDLIERSMTLLNSQGANRTLSSESGESDKESGVITNAMKQQRSHPRKKQSNKRKLHIDAVASSPPLSNVIPVGSSLLASNKSLISSNKKLRPQGPNSLSECSEVSKSQGHKDSSKGSDTNAYDREEANRILSIFSGNCSLISIAPNSGENSGTEPAQDGTNNSQQQHYRASIGPLAGNSGPLAINQNGELRNQGQKQENEDYDNNYEIGGVLDDLKDQITNSEERRYMAQVFQMKQEHAVENGNDDLNESDKLDGFDDDDDGVNRYFDDDEMMTTNDYANDQTLNSTSHQFDNSDYIDQGPLKSFSCEYCDQKFTTQSSLKRHMHRHYEDRERFTCEICNNSYSRKDYLREHKKNKHPDLEL